MRQRRWFVSAVECWHKTAPLTVDTGVMCQHMRLLGEIKCHAAPLRALIQLLLS